MPVRKVSDAQADDIRRRVAAGETLRRVAGIYGLSWSTVRNIVTRGYRVAFRERDAA